MCGNRDSGAGPIIGYSGPGPWRQTRSTGRGCDRFSDDRNPDHQVCQGCVRGAMIIQGLAAQSPAALADSDGAGRDGLGDDPARRSPGCRRPRSPGPH
jgi:hypothetical protein